MHRAELYNLRTTRLKFCKTCRIVKRKRLVTRDANTYGNGFLLASTLCNRQWFSTASKFQNPVQIQPSLYTRPHGANRFRRRMFLDRCKTEVTLGQRKRSVAPQCTVDTQINACHRLTDHLLMRLTAKTVEEHSREIQCAVIGAETECRRRRRCTNRLCINDEEDGGAQSLCNCSSRADAAPSAVIEPHDTLDDGDIRTRTFACENLRQPILGNKPGVQIMSRTAARELVIAKINVVRPHLERLHTKTTRAQSREKPCHKRCLAAARLCRRNNNARNIPLHEFSP